jgi:hypothetical protein
MYLEIYRMVYSSGSSRSRYSSSITNKCQGGGNKKPGLITRIVPSAVSVAHLGASGTSGTGTQPHHKSLPQTMVMRTHQKNVTNGMGVGRKIHTIRQTAWNTNGTSANNGWKCDA